MGVPAPSRRQLLDRDLEVAVADALACDQRLRGPRLSVRADGGVLHVSGEADSSGQLALAREVLGRLAGVYGIWDSVAVAGRVPLAVDLGCGAVTQHGDAVGVDLIPSPPVDVLADLADPLPFRDRVIDRIYAVHVLEHVPDMLALLDECHRVLRPDGVLHVLCPDRRHVNAYADPTHVRYLDLQTIKYVCVRHPGVECWWPRHAATDGTTVFADLGPVDPGGTPAAAERLARFFD
jgi:SAM-dependent methyltransferase